MEGDETPSKNPMANPAGAARGSEEHLGQAN